VFKRSLLPPLVEELYTWLGKYYPQRASQLGGRPCLRNTGHTVIPDNLNCRSEMRVNAHPSGRKGGQSELRNESLMRHRSRMASLPA